MADIDEPEGREKPDRVAHHGATDRELFRQLRLGG